MARGAVKKEKASATAAGATATAEPRQSRSTSNATMSNGVMPYREASVRATSVFSQATHTNTALATPPATMATSAAFADGDVHMSENDALPPDAMERLGQHSQQLIQAIQKLSVLNIDTTLQSLPKIVSIGDQSAGKSSIIEAMCDITLPKSDGRCTCCPFQITTTSLTTGSEPWTCRISLHIRYAYQPKQASRAGQPKEKYAHWAEQGQAASHQFATIYRKEDLGTALLRAQLAILNPGHDYYRYCNMSLEENTEGNQVQFSPNVVCLEIASAGLPELSFFDLPGAISSTPEERDEYLVVFLEELIKAYAGDNKAIILLACGANQDVETSTAIGFLRKCKTNDGSKACDRVLGILTKPDLVDVNPEKIAEFDRVLSGRKYPMGYGWFVTKQPSQKELQQGITHQQARQREADFFAAGPWIEELASHRDRLGTVALQDALSRLLTGHIRRELPGIEARVRQRLDEIDRKLATFPVQDAAPTIAIIQEIEKLKTSIMSQLNADQSSAFRTNMRQICRELKQKLKDCKPQAVFKTPGYVSKSISLLDTSEEDGSPSKKVKPNAREWSATPNGTPAPIPGSGTGRTTELRRKIPANNTSAAKPATFFVFKLEDVKRRLDSSPGADLGGPSNAVTKQLALDTMCGWKLVVNNALQKTEHAFQDMLTECIQESLAARRSTLLFEKAGDIVHDLYQELMKELRRISDRLIARELYRPVTYSSHLVGKRDRWETDLKALRLEQRAREYYEDLAATTNFKKPIEEAIQKSVRDAGWIEKELSKDDYDTAVKALGTPFAYYDIASEELCDNVVRNVEYELLREYELRVHRRLCEDLRTPDAAYCAQLLAEDPQRERERVALLEEKEKLNQALMEVRSLPDTYA